MPRNNRRNGKKREEHDELNMDSLSRGIRRSEIKRGVEYTIQSVTGKTEDGEKEWKCPHCNTTIHQGIAHLVAWDSHRGPTDRRHFHTPCWRAWQGGLL
ncbi:MAG: hypothetical protein ACKOWE_01660 [Micrococcales bacterium]